MRYFRHRIHGLVQEKYDKATGEVTWHSASTNQLIPRRPKTAEQASIGHRAARIYGISRKQWIASVNRVRF